MCTSPSDLAEREAFDPERRADRRARSLLSGKLIIGTGAAFLSADCVVQDLTAHGACVRVPEAVVLAPPVALLLTRDGVLWEATVVWREPTRTGLEFKRAHDLKTETDPAYRHVRALWDQLSGR